jgi:cobalt transporter subunit CbtB
MRRSSHSQANSSANSQADLKLLLALILTSSLVLLGVGFSTIVHLSTHDTGLFTHNLTSW